MDVVTSSNSGTETQLSLRNTSNGTNVSAGVAFGFNTVAADPDVLASIYGLVTDRNTRNGALTFSTAASATLTERARIASNGNMGIGATSPATRLYVDQGADSNGISLAYSVRGASRTEWELSGVSNENCSWIHNNGTNRFVMQTIGRDNVVWRTNDTERARIDSSGRIAFSNNGTSSDRLINAAFSGATTSGSNQFGLVLNPTYPNTVTSTLFNMYTGPNLTAGTTVTTVYGHYLEAINAAGSTVTNRWGLYQAGGSDKNYFAGFLFTGSQTNWNNSTQGSFTGASSGGGVGVYSFSNLDTSTGADASPSLVMNKGSATTSSSQRFIQFYSGGSSAQAMGGIVGNGAENVQFLTLSDEREKTNIAPVTGALSRIMQIQVSSFDRIGSNEHVKAGFVAQNVLPIYPEYVVENASNKGKEPRYGITGGMSAGFVAELTAALQELKAEFDAYKASHP